MGGKPSGGTTSTSTGAPWSEQQPYLTDIFGHAKGLYNDSTPQYFPDNTYQTPSSAQQNALTQIESLAQNGSGVVTPSVNFTKDMLSGYYANRDVAPGLLQGFATTSNIGGVPQLAALSKQSFGTTNPADATLKSYAAGDYLRAGNPNTQALTDQVLSQVVPGIQSQFISGGMLNSPEAARATAAGATSALAPLLFQNYQTQQQNQLGAANQLGQNYLSGSGLQSQIAAGLAGVGLQRTGLQQQAAQNLQGAFGQNIQQQLGALALAPTAQQMQYADPSQLYSAGATEQSLGQNSINDAVQRWNFSQSQPYQKLAQYLGAVTGNYGGTTNLTQPNTGAGFNMLGGALGGAQLAGSIFGGGEAASGIGAGLGGLMALFSDRRLKTDAVRLGTLDNGLPFYVFKYRNGMMLHVGVMADEVERVHPEAVFTMPDGMKMVDYARAVN